MAQQVQVTDGITTGAVEESARAPYTSRAVHYRIHNSNGWISSHMWIDVATTASVYLHIKTNNTINPHGNFTIESEAKVTIEFFENPTLTGDGTGLAENCLNRQDPATSTTKCFRDPTVSDDGTLLEINMLGSVGKFTDIGGTETDRGYWALKRNESYLVKVTNNHTEAKDIVISYIWHEHTE